MSFTQSMDSSHGNRSLHVDAETNQNKRNSSIAAPTLCPFGKIFVNTVELPFNTGVEKRAGLPLVSETWVWCHLSNGSIDILVHSNNAYDFIFAFFLCFLITL